MKSCPATAIAAATATPPSRSSGIERKTVCRRRVRYLTAHRPSPIPHRSVRIAIYAGSFDPITRGHEDLVARSLEFVDRLIVAVANNVAKQPLFTVDERVALIRAAVKDKSGV